MIKKQLLRTLVELFGDRKNEVRFFLMSKNGYLVDQVPNSLIEIDPERVLGLAVIYLNPIEEL